jgi:hypothetical protein
VTAPQDLKSTYPPNNAVRVGTVTRNDDGVLSISVQGEIIPGGWLDLSGTITADDSVAVIRGESSWLILGAVRTTPTVPRVATSIVTSSSSTFTALTSVMSVTASLKANVTYKVTAFSHFASTVANDTVTVRLRQDTISGTDLNLDPNVLITSTGGVSSYVEAEYTPTIDVTKTFVLGAQRATGAGNITLTANSNFPSYLYVDYVRGI